MERPIIEFLATDKFGIVQTGSRALPGLVVNYYGNPVATLQSGRVLSSLFGQALKILDSGWVYIDVPGDELSFSGSTTTLGSFTFGMYIYRPESLHQDMMGAVVAHNVGDVDMYTSLRFAVPSNSGILQINQVNSAGTVIGTPAMSTPNTNWHHVAYSYEASTKQLNGYMDGTRLQSITLADGTGFGNAGAYLLYISVFLLHLIEIDLFSLSLATHYHSLST